MESADTITSGERLFYPYSGADNQQSLNFDALWTRK